MLSIGMYSPYSGSGVTVQDGHVQSNTEGSVLRNKFSFEAGIISKALSTPTKETLSLGNNDVQSRDCRLVRSSTCPEGLLSLTQLATSCSELYEEDYHTSHLLKKEHDIEPETNTGIPHDVTPVDEPRRSPNEAFRSWRGKLESRSSWITLCLSIIPINFLIGMDFLSFPIYYVEYTLYFVRSSKSVIGLIVAIKMTQLSVFGIVTSSLIPRFGCKRICMVGGIIMFVGLLLSCFATNIMTLCFTQGFVLGIGYSCVTMTTNIVIQKNFQINGALGEGIAMLGISMGNISGPPLINWLIQTYSWRGSLLIHAAIIAHIVPFGALLNEARTIGESHNESRDISVEREESYVIPCDQPCDISVLDLSVTEQRDDHKITVSKKMKQLLKDIFDFRLFRYFPFLLISISGTCDRFCITTFMQHVPSRAVHLGMSLTDGATFLSTCAMSIVIFRAVVTVVANLKVMSRVIWYGLGGLVGGLDAFIMVIFKTYEGQLAGAIVNGIHIGITNTITNVMLVDLMGISQLPRAMALFNITVGVASMSAAPIAGFLYDVTNNYDPPFILAGVLGIVSGICGITAAILNTRTIKRKERELANEMLEYDTK